MHQRAAYSCADECSYFTRECAISHMWHLSCKGAFVAAGVVLTFGICDNCNAVNRLGRLPIGRTGLAGLFNAFAETRWAGKSVKILRIEDWDYLETG